MTKTHANLDKNRRVSELIPIVCYNPTEYAVIKSCNSHIEKLWNRIVYNQLLFINTHIHQRRTQLEYVFHPENKTASRLCDIKSGFFKPHTLITSSIATLLIILESSVQLNSQSFTV